MTNLSWRTEHAWRENLVALSAAVLLGAATLWLATTWYGAAQSAYAIAAFTGAWSAFATFRSRPREVALVDLDFALNNHGSYSLRGLTSARERRLLGLERVLELRVGSVSQTFALHGVPEPFRLQLLAALNERVAR
jgi:hypothetical protein